MLSVLGFEQISPMNLKLTIQNIMNVNVYSNISVKINRPKIAKTKKVIITG